MPRTLPDDFERNLLRDDQKGSFLWLCEIVVPNQRTHRLVDSPEDVTYDSDVYSKAALGIGQQSFGSGGQMPQIMVRVANVQGTIENMINSSSGASGGTIQLIKVNDDYLSSSIPALEADYDILMAESDDDYVTFTIGVPNLLTQRFPLREYSHNLCPWATPTLFKGPECGYSGGETSCNGTLEDCRDNKSNATRYGGEIGLDPSILKT